MLPLRPARRVLLVAAALAVCPSPSAGRAAPPAAPPDQAREVAFLRVSRDAGGAPLSLDTSVVEYLEPAEGAAAAGRSRPVQVDLVAAVHLGSGGYYAALNRLFRDYDSVLYELVAPPNARVPKPGRKPAGMIGSAQKGLTDLLGLEYQLDRIDYTAGNLVHADLSPREFDAAMAKRGETWWTMFARLMRESMARAESGKQPPGGEIGLGEVIGLLFGAGPDRQVRLRRIMAEQFTDMEVLTAAFGGEDGSTLITDRNSAALAVLRTRIEAGDRRIAIFYGAAHMNDFDRRLQRDFQVQPRETAWLEAWDLRTPAAERR